MGDIRRKHQPGRRQALKGLAAAGLAGALPLSSLAQPKPVNVGVILPLSGANAQFGINSRQGIELVVDEPLDQPLEQAGLQREHD